MKICKDNILQGEFAIIKRLNHSLLIICLFILPSLCLMVAFDLESNDIQMVDAASSRKDIAYYWAPVIFQEQGDHPKFDCITRFDFDGDWIGNNNWANAYTYADLQLGYVYYSVVETSTNYFIGYYTFHPRDYMNDGDVFENEHENDMEGLLLVIKKGDQWGELLCIITEAHNELLHYTDPSYGLRDDKATIDGDIIYSNDFDVDIDIDYSISLPFDPHKHPVVFCEGGGHGVFGTLTMSVISDYYFIYKPTGSAELPNYEEEEDDYLGYELISIDELWNKRNGPYGSGHTFGRFEAFDGVYYSGMYGGEDKAKAPWGWDDGDDGSTYTGEIFYNPRDMVATQLDGLGGSSEFSAQYTYNPYAVELRIDHFRCNTDRDDELFGTDRSDPYLVLYMFDGQGRETPDNGVLHHEHASQKNWHKENSHQVWLDMRDEIDRPFYGIRYPNKPLFGFESRDEDAFFSDDWLMGDDSEHEKEYTHWYARGPLHTYESRDCGVVNELENHLDWGMSEINFTLLIGRWNFPIGYKTTTIVVTIVIFPICIYIIRKRRKR